MKKRIILIFSVVVGVCLLIAGYIYSRPVSWDAGGCSGGYTIYLFDKYNGELVGKYMDKYRNEKDIVHLSVNRDTASAEMDGREIKMEFDVQYELKNGESVTERIGFVGKRYWIDSFKWSGPFEDLSDYIG